MPSLEISGADVLPQTLPLPDGSTILGRAPESTILLDHPQVSRRHAEIRINGPRVEIADLGSANGTLLNRAEVPVKEWQALRENDRVEIGPFALVLRNGGAAPATSMATSISQTSILIAPPSPPVLVIRTVDGAREVSLREASYTIGRNADNDIVINDQAVSRSHARLDKRANSYEITDLGSTNGLAFGTDKVDRRLLAPGDMLRIGTTIELEYRTPERSTETSRASIDVRRKSETLLGRGAGEDAIDHPQVSRVHARILNENGRLVIEDAGSEAGTFVNGNRVQRQVLNDGDAIRLGGQALRLVNGQLVASDADELSLETVNLRREVGNGVTILQDVSIAIKSREFMAIVGPSGAGKSTLITAMCGYQLASSGNVLINGSDFYSHIEAYRSEIGFVPQDDIIHRELSITRAFNYACQLRMPEDTQSFERDGRIYEVLQELDLSEHAEKPVRQLSGGQRKRTSLGVELLTQPSLLFLDEATSGLDPHIETEMMKLFRKLADNGRIVVLVTHATKNVMICDKVAFMAKGGYLAFYGPPDEALTYFGVKDFDEIYALLETKPGVEWAHQFLAFLHHTGQSQQAPHALPQAQADTSRVQDTAPPRSPFKQFVTLTSRSLEIMYRSPKDVAVLLALAPFLGLLNFVIWSRDTFDFVKGDSVDGLNLFFMLTIVTLLVGSLGSVREIVKEQAIYRRERGVCLQVLPYVMSKIFVGFLFAFYSATVLFVLQIAAVDFSYLTSQELLQLFVPVFLATMSGVTIGLLVSALSGSEERAMLLIIAVIIPQFLLSGGLLPIKDLGGVGPYLTFPATAKWAYAALLTTSEIKEGPCVAEDLSDCSIPGIGALETVPEKVALVKSLDKFGEIYDVNLLEYWLAMVGLILVAIAGVLILQKRKDTV